MIPDSILYNLRESAMFSAERFIDTYLENEQLIVDEISKFNGVKSEFYCKDLKSLKDIPKFLSIFSDFTSIFTTTGTKSDYHLKYFTDDHRYNISRKVSMPASLVGSNLHKGTGVIPAYLYKNNQDLREIILTLQPFFENGQFVLRPIRTLVVRSAESILELYHAYSDTPIDEWTVKVGSEEDSFLIDNIGKAFQSKTLFDLTIPYFENISMRTLAKILEDETDAISQFRVALKDIANELENTNADIKQLQNEKIRPQLEQLNRRFKGISNRHRFTVGGALSVFTLSLIGVVTEPGINFQTLFALGGASTLGMFASQVKRNKEEEDQRDNPLFLLWKISKGKN